MEVVEARSALLTNAEVLQILRDAKEANAKRPANTPQKGSNRFHSTLIYEATKYLQNSPAASQQRGDVVTMMKRLRAQFPHLTATELVQLANIRPRTLVEVQLIVEDCEERMTEAEVEELITIVVDSLPDPQSGSMNHFSMSALKTESDEAMAESGSGH